MKPTYSSTKVNVKNVSLNMAVTEFLLDKFAFFKDEAGMCWA